jgi:hypothetical protein
MQIATWITALAACAWIVIMGAGVYVAQVERRPPVEALILTMHLGPLGLLVGAMLPTVEDDNEDEDDYDSE